LAVEDQFQRPSAFEADEAASIADLESVPDSIPNSVVDGFRLIDGESVVESLEVGGSDRFVLTDRRVIYIGGDEEHRNWSFAPISEISSVRVTRVARERSSLIWGVLGLIASIGIWQVATNDKIGVIGGIVMALLGAILLWDYYLRTPPSRLLFDASGKDIGGPLNRSSEDGARSFGDMVFELKARNAADSEESASTKPAGTTRRYRYPGS
jgi:hypothetical protein